MGEEKNIRNFCIIAHIDHGKSTLADRLLEKTNTVTARNKEPQILDSHPIERERGVTIKLAPVRMSFFRDNTSYVLNLIDTPGHVDFAYEVSRSLAACEGAILLVDATQGVEAQTLSHFRKAQKQNLIIIPVINKIDLPNARPEKVAKELEELFSIKRDEILFISAKTGEGVDHLMSEIINRIPSPCGNAHSPLRALVFNSLFDQYKGVIVCIRLVDGKIKTNETEIEFLKTGVRTKVRELGYFTPERQPSSELTAGEVGFVATGLKDIAFARVGDTVVNSAERKIEKIFPLPGYERPKPAVFLSFFPENPAGFSDLESALLKLSLSDSSLVFQKIDSKALGRGFRCGFLGLFHAEIVGERLKVDYNQEVIKTSPNINYRITLKNGKEMEINDPSRFPPPSETEKVEEPYAKVNIFSPAAYVGRVTRLCQERRGSLKQSFYEGEDVSLVFEMPLAEIIFDFFDLLKSETQGFATLDYEPLDFRKANVARIDFLVNDTLLDPLSIVVSKEKEELVAREGVEKLKDLIPRQQFEVKIQSMANGRIVRAEKLSPFRKDVTQKLYGGDRTRKDKLLEAQKEGKKKMATIGKIEIPTEAFGRFLKT